MAGTLLMNTNNNPKYDDNTILDCVLIKQDNHVVYRIYSEPYSCSFGFNNNRYELRSKQNSSYVFLVLTDVDNLTQLFHKSTIKLMLNQASDTDFFVYNDGLYHIKDFLDN